MDHPAGNSGTDFHCWRNLYATPEEREKLALLFMAGADDACRNADKLYDDALRLALGNIYESVS